jgi:NADH-quinone oxidoreductase subunit J
MTGAWIWVLLAALGVFGAGAVAFAKNVVHCGFGLLAALVSVAAMYAFLGADFLVATQVIVYVGSRSLPA